LNNIIFAQKAVTDKTDKMMLFSSSLSGSHSLKPFAQYSLPSHTYESEDLHISPLPQNLHAPLSA